MKLKRQTSPGISTKPTQTKPFESILAEMFDLQSTRLYLHCDVSSRDLKASIVQSCPCKDGQKLAGFTECNSKDGAKSNVSLLTELLPIYSIKTQHFKIF